MPGRLVARIVRLSRGRGVPTQRKARLVIEAAQVVASDGEASRNLPFGL